MREYASAIFSGSEKLLQEHLGFRHRKCRTRSISWTEQDMNSVHCNFLYRWSWILLLDSPQYGHRELRPVVCPYNMKTPAEESIAVSLIPDDTHFLCIKDFICWKKPVFPQTFVPLHLVGATDSFVRFFTHKDTKKISDTYNFYTVYLFDY